VIGKSVALAELKINGKSLFTQWLNKLSKTQQQEVDARLERVRAGNLGLHRNFRHGIIELKLVSGLRIYGGWEGEILFLLILGGDKKGQQADIDLAEEIWISYTKSKGSQK